MLVSEQHFLFKLGDDCSSKIMELLSPKEQGWKKYKHQSIQLFNIGHLSIISPPTPIYFKKYSRKNSSKLKQNKNL